MADVADAGEVQGDCWFCSPGLLIAAGGALILLVGLDMLSGGKVLGWLPVPALFGSTVRPEVADSSAGD